MRTLVVGVDGSASSMHALDWAADAVSPDGELHVVTALEGLDEAPEVVAGALAERLTRIEPRVHTVTSATADTRPVEALNAVAGRSGAHAIVVGAHVPALGVPKRIGRTIRSLVEPLERPLIVVPTAAVIGRADDDPVIVGVGHTDASEAAVRWGARWADDCGVPLGLVKATSEFPTFDLDGLLRLLAYYIDPSQRAVWTHEDLVEFARIAVEASDPDLEVATSAVEGRASTALVESAIDASLLVIGRHQSNVFGDGHTTRLLRHALTHATCPVVIVPPEATSD